MIKRAKKMVATGYWTSNNFNRETKKICQRKFVSFWPYSNQEAACKTKLKLYPTLASFFNAGNLSFFFFLKEVSDLYLTQELDF